MKATPLPCPAPPRTIAALAFALALVPHGALAQHVHHAGMPMPQSQDEASQSQPPATPATQDEPAAASDHAAMGHDHASMQHGATSPPQSPYEPVPPIGPEDIAAAFPDIAPHTMQDDAIHSDVLFDRLETGLDDGAQSWAARAWIGTDRNRLWLRSEGERDDGRTHAADLELLYGRAITPWWDLLAGVRHDFAPGPAQEFLAIGVAGLAPYKFEVAATAYLGESGQAAARVEIEYDILLSNRLILQPLLEANLYGQDDPVRRLGSGLATVETGLRLRYEITRRFAPYIGITRERAFGDTATLRNASGEDHGGTRVVAGVRAWF